MKKCTLHLREYLIVMVLTFTIVFPSIQAQEPAPAIWNSFINSVANPIVSDTFRMQTFEGKETDNWTYVLSAGAEVTNQRILTIPLGSKVTFTPYYLSSYQNVSISIHMASFHLMINENLIFKCLRQGVQENLPAVSPKSNNKSYPYDTKIITKGPCTFDIEAAQPASNTQQGYFETDSVYALGDIPQYSLFTGSGNWNDTARWSHLPPLRHRNALIDGEVTLTSNIYCNNIALNRKGSLRLMPGSHLTLNNITLYGTDNSILSEGDITINGKITLHKTFDKTGTWYFISFPFDVYPKGVDTRFIQKDATPNNGGNYFYVQTYNGDKRARNNQPTGNWEVLPIRPANTPLFEKNKGYLIALDEKATDRTLTFSSRAGDIPVLSASNTLSIAFSNKLSSENENNFGWYLCGNPLLSPMSLSQIEANPSLDGNIYIYTGSGYKNYSFGTDKSLSPFDAFFVKASESTELYIYPTTKETSSDQILKSSCLQILRNEPSADQATGIPFQTKLKSPSLSIQNGTLHLRNLPAKASLSIHNLLGTCLLKQSATSGDMAIPFQQKPGMYMLHIKSPLQNKCIKFLLHE